MLSMKKANGKRGDELRAEYKRSDFGQLVRGKHAQRSTEQTNIVVLDRKAKATRSRRARRTG